MALNLLVSLFSILISAIFPQPRALQYSQQDSFAFGPNLIHSIITPTSSPTSSTSISPPQPSSLVPALFIIGDSSVDCGTNNFLATLARADHLPYGRDFDTHRPTGRFCNGRIPVDYLGNVGLYFFGFFFEDPFVWLLRKWRGRKLKFESCGIFCFFQDPFVWSLRKWREEERNFESCGMFLFSWFFSCLLFTDPMFGHWEKVRKYNKFWSYGYFLFWLLL